MSFLRWIPLSCLAQCGFAQQAPWGRADIPISSHDRVYAADQTSNTVSVINPSTNGSLGEIRLGDPVPAALSPLYKGELIACGCTSTYQRRGPRLTAPPGRWSASQKAAIMSSRTSSMKSRENARLRATIPSSSRVRISESMLQRGTFSVGLSDSMAGFYKLWMRAKEQQLLASRTFQSTPSGLRGQVGFLTNDLCLKCCVQMG